MDSNSLCNMCLVRRNEEQSVQFVLNYSYNGGYLRLRFSGAFEMISLQKDNEEQLQLLGVGLQFCGE